MNRDRIYVIFRFCKLYWGRFVLVLGLFFGVIIFFAKLPNILSYMINANTFRTEKALGLSPSDNPSPNVAESSSVSLPPSVNPQDSSVVPPPPPPPLDILFVRDDSILTDKGVLHIGDSFDGYTLHLISRPSRTCHFSSDYGDFVLRY